MSAGATTYFADTNLLLYWHDSADAFKQARAQQWLACLWSQGAGRLSWQVLHEYYANATRKLHVSTRLARALVREFTLWQPVEASLGLVNDAWGWCDHAEVSYWDGLILAAAGRCEADYLLSEDFQSGRKYGGCTVLDPFRSDPAEHFPAP